MISENINQSKIKNPFLLLQKNDQQLRQMQIVKIQPRTIKNTVNMPFAPYDIKHQQKVKKMQSAKKQNSQKKQSCILVEQNSSDIKVVLKQQKSVQQMTDQHKAKSTNIEQSSIQQENQKKYFLQKKQRISSYSLNCDGDPPLLYDIGLDAQMIKDKMRLVVLLKQPDYDILMNPDLAGPICIAFTFAFLLLLSGQLHFGDIYALFIFGNLALFILFNFMNKVAHVSLYSIMSILGYCLLPMLLLGFIGIGFRLKCAFGIIISLFISVWSSAAAGNFIAALIRGKKNRKILIAYPLFLFYLSFATMVIF